MVVDVAQPLLHDLGLVAVLDGAPEHPAEAGQGVAVHGSDPVQRAQRHEEGGRVTRGAAELAALSRQLSLREKGDGT